MTRKELDIEALRAGVQALRKAGVEDANLNLAEACVQAYFEKVWAKTWRQAEEILRSLEEPDDGV